MKKVFIGGVLSSGKHTIFNQIRSKLDYHINYLDLYKNYQFEARKSGNEFKKENYLELEEKIISEINNFDLDIIINGNYTLPIYNDKLLLGFENFKINNFDGYILISSQPENIFSRREKLGLDNLSIENISKELNKEKQKFLEVSYGKGHIIENNNLDFASKKLIEILGKIYY